VVCAIFVIGLFVGVGTTLLAVSVKDGPMWSVDTAWAMQIVDNYHPSGAVTMPAWSQHLKDFLYTCGCVALAGAAIAGAVLVIAVGLYRRSARLPSP
jgi:hypothetical protein